MNVQSPGAGTATGGTVTFKIDGVTPTGGTVNLNASGKASFTTSTLGNGPHSITATYSGNVSFAASTSNTLTQRVLKASTTTLTTSSSQSLRRTLPRRSHL